MIAEPGTRNSVHLDFVRGAAAVAVLIAHARALFFVDYAELTDPALAVRATYFVTGFGHQAVMVFFVLSGFFITSSVHRLLPRWSWRTYLTDRGVRLYLVLVPGLAWTWMCDWAGQTWAAMPGIYTGEHAGTVLQYSVVERTNLYTLLVNLAFLQSVLAPPFGSNSPLWSLCNEFWYYLIFPALLLAAKARRAAPAIAYVGGALGALAFLGPEISLYFMIWLLGVAVFWLPPRDSFRGRAGTLLLTLVSVGVVLALTGSRVRPGWWGWDHLIGLLCAAWLYLFLHRDSAPLEGWYSWGAKKLAGCSYTLYVIHMPTLVMAYALWLGTGRWLPTTGCLLNALLLSIAVVAGALALARCTEGNTGTVRRAIQSLWTPAKSVAAKAELVR